MDVGARRGLPRALLVVIRPFQAFLATSSASGIVLLAATIAAMLWANSRFEDLHHRIFHGHAAISAYGRTLDWPLHAWINDAAMAIFFFLVGMEIKRELVVGELRTFRRALLPGIAALGGMIVPAAIYMLLNRGGPGERGWGIPMATDIAFALGCLAVLRGRVAPSLSVFLTALAIFDDLGAIVVIAIFYGHGVQLGWLAVAGLVSLLLVALNRIGVRTPLPYAVVGVVLWYVVLRSGIHATIAGVIAGLAIPARAEHHPRETVEELEGELARLKTAYCELGDDDEGNAALRAIEAHLERMQPPLNRLTHVLHAPVAFGIVPLFALANAGISFAHMGKSDLLSPVAVGVALGLLLGKPIGVFLFTFAAVKLRLGPMPEGATYRQVLGIAILAGIGFTMSLFISGLAFADAPRLGEAAKIGILAGSAASAIIGMALLRFGKPSLRA
ncbi:MAG: Na+/H+ antiporter NhaA [Polyangiales bacterium]